MKLLKLKMHPWWFHFLGNHIACLQLQQSHPHEAAPADKPRRVGKIKIVNSDGHVKIYERPIHVSELMMEFPKHLVCRSDSFYIGQKIPTLSENEKLQLGQNYFLLPNQFFQTVFSFVTIASLASRNAFFKKAASCRQPFDIHKSASGCPRIRVSDEFISQLIEQGSCSNKLRGDDDATSLTKVCNTAQLHKDYTQLVGLRRWKPKLETIREKEKNKKRFSSFVMKRRNKLCHQKNQKSTTPDHFVCVTSTKSSSKSSKIKIKSSRKWSIG